MDRRGSRDMLQDGDEPLLVYLAFPVIQLAAFAHHLKDVVHARQRQVGMLGLPLLAVRVKALGDGADALLLRVRGVGEGKGVKTDALVIAGVIAHAEPPARRQSPTDMETAGKHAKMESVFGGYVYQHGPREIFPRPDRGCSLKRCSVPPASGGRPRFSRYIKARLAPF